MFQETKKAASPIMIKKAIEEVNGPARTDKKAFQRKQIQDEVFDYHDSIADNAKWLSILTTFMSRIYDILPEEQKINLDPDEREMIETLFEVFGNTYTRADRQFSEEGTETVLRRILNRQGQIGNIIK